MNKPNQEQLDLWEKVQQGMINSYGKNVFNSWIGKLSLKECTSNRVILSAPTNFIRDWIQGNYLVALCNEFARINPSYKFVELITSKEDGKSLKKETTNLDSKDSDNDSMLSSNLEPRFTFDSFVVGTPNEFAYAAARSVAESRAFTNKSNPLFLYGGVGLGKTHLMHATAWHIRKTNPQRKVIYLTAEKFMNQFIKALRAKDTVSFKDRFRTVDVLMIDDIQFICGKESTQEEFFHTFNALIDNKRQMVISCDRSPSDLDDIEDRIKSRLGWGLVADVHSTTYELRVGILQSKLEHMKITVPKNVIEFLASKITTNIRELEGALNKVIAHATLIGKEINIDNCKDILSDLLRNSEKYITVDLVQKKVSEYYNIRVSDMSSSKKIREVARPRQVAMYLSKKLTSKSLAEIGRRFGKKDHSTVIHAVKKIDELCISDPELREEIHLLTKILQN